MSERGNGHQLDAPTWVFDVDGTLIDSMTGRSLRPNAAALLSHLHSSGSTTLLWSAGGADYARRRAEEHAIAGLFAGFHGKEQRDEHGRYLTSAFLADHVGVVFVDDMPADLPIGADIVGVRPYLAPNAHDRGLDLVGRRAGLATHREDAP